MQWTHRRIVSTVAGLVLTLGAPCLPISRWENEFAGVGHLVGYEVIWWSLVALVLLHVRRVERRSLATIGFRAPGIGDVLLGAAAGIAIVGGLAGIYYVLFPLLDWNEDETIGQLVATPVWWLFISVIRAAVAEEVLFRGYAIERIQEGTGSPTIAAVLSCAVFALAHVGSWGWAHVLVAGFAGAVFTLIYLWRRNLWVTIIAHFVVDGTAVLLA